ncbi:MAG: hypothetical protein KAT34_01630 [Candidatus Aminicenantes bacterium]|nr:hypothetical protein [Candidatus Aminicenantes bacterium]
MIDIHTHIIPAVDDGSPSLEESLKMLRMCRDDGVKTIAATPHVFHAGIFTDFGETQRGIFRQKFNELNKSVKDHRIEIEILPGAEVFFFSDLRKKIENHRELLTINNSDYFLLEFPADVVFEGSKEYIFDLVTDGLIPIICHPERNPVFQQNPRLLYQILQAGALSQVDAGSIRGDFGVTVYAAAMKFLKHNLVHILASDCHDSRTRPPGLSFIYKQMHEIEREKIDMLVKKVPLAVVNDNVVPDTGPILDPDRRTTFFDFIRSFRK